MPAVEVSMNHEHEDDDHIEWSLCCSKSSKSFIKYITTVCMSVIVMVFCILRMTILFILV